MNNSNIESDIEIEEALDELSDPFDSITIH